LSQPGAPQFAPLLRTLGDERAATTNGNTAVPAAAVTAVANTAVTLPAGLWLLWGWGCVLMGAAAGNCDLYLREGATVVSQPGTVYLPANQQTTVVVPPCRVLVNDSATRTFQLTAFAGVACAVQGIGGAAGLGGATGVRAVRVG
jgi:hypothetical protein